MSQLLNYRKLNQELEVIIEKLQSNELDVDETIKEYEKGIMIVDQLEKYLLSAQNKITKIGQKNTKKSK